MTRFLMLAATILTTQSAMAGGVHLRNEYRGTHPLGTTAVALSVAGQEGVLEMGHGRIVGKLQTVGFSSTEGVFNLLDAQGAVIGKIVTEPPCVDAEKIALILPSGLNIVLEYTP